MQLLSSKSFQIDKNKDELTWNIHFTTHECFSWLLARVWEPSG